MVFYSCEEILLEQNLTNSTVELLAPSGGAIVETSPISFNWSAVKGASAHHLPIATPDFAASQQVITDSIVDDNFYFEELPDGAYEWGICKKIYITRFTHTMMLLTKSKILVVSGLGMVRELVNFHSLQESLQCIQSDILQGQRMSDSYKKHELFDKKMIALLKVAEETNQTEFVFQKLHDQYSREVEYQSKTITNVLNPLLTLLEGLLVGIILIAMYLPKFWLSSVIG